MMKVLAINMPNSRCQRAAAPAPGPDHSLSGRCRGQVAGGGLLACAPVWRDRAAVRLQKVASGEVSRGERESAERGVDWLRRRDGWPWQVGERG